MQDWLTNDQRMDPFDPANPMDADDICDNLQRYWNTHFKDEKVERMKNKRKNEEARKDDQGSQKKPRRDGEGGGRGRGNDSSTRPAGRGGVRDNNSSNHGVRRDDQA